MVRALILRRVALIKAGGSGPVLIGHLMRLKSFLDRNGYPHHVLDIAQDPDAAALHQQYGAAAAEALAVCPDGSVLLNPSETELARCIGMVDTIDHHELFDVVVVGAGPAGLATAVYAASEGTGISGPALAGRAYVQAQKFGAQALIPAQVQSLDCSECDAQGELRLTLADGRKLRSRTVVVASGARYRRPAVPRLAEFEGQGVWYWASALEARMCAGSEVVLVGGGNSAGQAAVFLSQHAAKVHMLVRGPSLAASMSRYLGDKAAQRPGHTPAPLETSVPGVFAVGDVRSGSVKRVGGAIGEGAAVVAMIHQRLAATAQG